MVELSLKIIALALLKKQVAAEFEAAKEEWGRTHGPGDRKGAVVSGQLIGKVEWRGGKQSWKLTKPELLLAWAQENMPQEVKFEPFLNPGWVTQVSKNPVTKEGEVLPGFELVESKPTVYASPSTESKGGVDGAAVLSRALADGSLSFSEVLAVEQ